MYNLKDDIKEVFDEHIKMMPKQFFNVTVAYQDKHLVKEINFEEYDSLPYYPRVSQYLQFHEENMPQFPIRGVRIIPKKEGNIQLKNISELNSTLH